MLEGWSSSAAGKGWELGVLGLCSEGISLQPSCTVLPGAGLRIPLVPGWPSAGQPCLQQGMGTDRPLRSLSTQPS